MVKRSAILALSVLLISLSFISASFAEDDFFIRMVTGNNQTTAQTDATYGWTQEPWLYISLPSPVFSYTITWWNLSGTPTWISNLTTNDQGKTELWSNVADWFNEPGSRHTGLWNVKAIYTADGQAYSKETTFTVTPEPISSALFLLGGVGLTAWQIRRKKKLNSKS
ncbi:MAG: PEP-CTERM sorting domain-containing protein [Candidatus Omnitrophota bacterium]